MNSYPNTCQANVSLVGAGPGDPDLLTLKALKLLKKADVVLYDRLVSKEILALVPSGVSCISVGKQSGKHCVPQDEMNEMLVRLACHGRQVVRLKGGDPYTFGRGSEEALYLKNAGVPFEVVPGISAASGCGSYSGIPLTHRGLANSVRFITGHFREDQLLEYDWDKLADPDCTLVIYMGISNIQTICDQLQQAGLAASTAAAVIHKGTTDEQQQIISNLKDLPADIRQAALEAPAIIMIGKVVSLATELGETQQLSNYLNLNEASYAHGHSVSV